ncbi:MAG: T9SS type A sorting domain-containing protein [Bacteroidetes bacterium]|nr:T9SS type A sorting domain-containing protein [Bacteroidota bacterium]
MFKLLLILFFSFIFLTVQAQQWKVWNSSNSNIPTNNLINLYIDSSGIIWIGSGDFGLIRFDGINFSSYNSGNSPMKSNLVKSMSVDKFENLWLCAFRQGSGNEGALMKFDRKNNWSYYNSQNSGIENGNQFSVNIDTNNIVWCIYNSLSKFDGTNWFVYDSKNSPLRPSTASEIYVDKQNNKWIGLDFYGLYKLANDNTWTLFSPNNSGIGGTIIRKIREDNTGNYWINISYSGLCKYNASSNSWQNWTPQNSNLISAHPLGLFIDKRNIKWIGFNSTETGLAEFADTQFVYSNPPVIGNGTNIYDIKEDKLGNLWIATASGLLEFNKNGIVGINNSYVIVPTAFELSQNYPNPFNPSTTIIFQIPKNNFVNLKIFDINGKEISQLVNETLNAGEYKINFDGSEFPSGVYYYKLAGDNFSEVKKMVLVK